MSARAAALCVLLGTALPAVAQEERGDREVSAARERIEALVREAAELREAGQVEEAQARLREAEGIETRLERFLARRERPRGEGERLGEIVVSLERSRVALAELGRGEVAEQLAELIAHLRRQMEPRERPEPGRSEREVAMHQLEVMKTALAAQREAGRENIAELLHRAIRAREVALEGRRDEEAREIRRGAPDRGQLVEVLNDSARLWREFGGEEQAATVAELAEQLNASLQRRREVERRGRERESVERDRPEPEREREEVERRRESRRRDRAEPPRRAEGEQLRRTIERIERLEERMAEIGRALEIIQDRLARIAEADE